MTTATTAVEEAAVPPSTEDPQDECVICCYPLPLLPKESNYQECCGEVICIGCLVAEERVLILGENVEKPIPGSKEEELEFMTMLLSEQTCVCPFCRAEAPADEKEGLERLWNRIDEFNDPKAMFQMGVHYYQGHAERGLSKNLKKAEELYQRAYDLGYPEAAFNLSLFYINDEAREIKYLEEGARRGDLKCMNNLGYFADRSGNHEEAERHLMMAACSGHVGAMGSLAQLYRNKQLSVEDITTAIYAHEAAKDSVKSEAREYANRYHNFLEKKAGIVNS